MAPTPSPVGRPRASSLDAIAEAATELFLEHGYDAVTVGDITQRVGVSRNTFFNYFKSKSDLLWYGFDQHLKDLEEQLRRRPCPVDFPAAVATLEAVFRSVSARFSPAVIGPAFNQAEVMGVGNEFSSSAQERHSALTQAILGWLPDPLAGLSGPQRRVLAGASALAFMVGVGAWIEAGSTREPLASYVSDALGVLRPPATR